MLYCRCGTVMIAAWPATQFQQIWIICVSIICDLFSSIIPALVDIMIHWMTLFHTCYQPILFIIIIVQLVVTLLVVSILWDIIQYVINKCPEYMKLLSIIWYYEWRRWRLNTQVNWFECIRLSYISICIDVKTLQHW